MREVNVWITLKTILPPSSLMVIAGCLVQQDDGMGPEVQLLEITQCL